MKNKQQSSGVIFLQRVNSEKIQQARELRKRATPAEEKLWSYLRGNKITGVKFRRQQIIEGFIVDFFCHKAKLVIEIDGSIHDNEEQEKLDTHRRKVFEARGLVECRFRNEEVIGNIENVVATIREIVDARV